MLHHYPGKFGLADGLRERHEVKPTDYEYGIDVAWGYPEVVEYSMKFVDIYKLDQKPFVQCSCGRGFRCVQ